MEIQEVVTKLVGEIRPIGETNIDNTRLENLKVMCGLIEELLAEIVFVESDFRGRSEYSLKRASEVADKFIKATRDCLQE